MVSQIETAARWIKKKPIRMTVRIVMKEKDCLEEKKEKEGKTEKEYGREQKEDQEGMQ